MRTEGICDGEKPRTTVVAGEPDVTDSRGFGFSGDALNEPDRVSVGGVAVAGIFSAEEGWDVSVADCGETDGEGEGRSSVEFI